MTAKLLSHWSVYDTCSLMSGNHQSLLLDIVSRLSSLSSSSDTLSPVLRTLYTLLLSKDCSASQRVKVINLLKVSGRVCMCVCVCVYLCVRLCVFLNSLKFRLKF